MAVRRVGASAEGRPRRSSRSSKDHSSSYLEASQTKDVVTKTAWESIRAVALALAAVAVPLLLLQLKFVKDFSGIIAEDEYQACSGMATSCLYVMVCVQMQARSRRTIKSGSMVRRLSL
jgi:hypothetical protein